MILIYQNGLQTVSLCLGRGIFGFGLGNIMLLEGGGLKSLPEQYPLSDSGEFVIEYEMPSGEDSSFGMDNSGTLAVAAAQDEA